MLAVDLVMRDECRTAFCAVRPPGHHAERGRAMGFASSTAWLSAPRTRWLRTAWNASRVVDFDVHHGNGTEEIFSDDPRVLMVSTFQHPLYPYCGLDNPAPNMVNVPLAAGSGGDEFRAAVRDRWLPGARGAPAATDPHFGGLRRASREIRSPGSNSSRPITHGSRAKWSRWRSATRRGAWCRCLEGGYALSALGRSAAEHVRELLAARGVSRVAEHGAARIPHDVRGTAAALALLAFDAARADTPPRWYSRTLLTDVHGRPVRTRDLAADTNYVFQYPFAATPCLLVKLSRPRGCAPRI